MHVTHASPNHNARPAGVEPTLIVLHATAGGRESSDVYWCRSAESKVSYHAIVGRKGTVYGLVAPERRAWHAGVSEWDGRKNVNDFSIGLAFANRNDGEPLTEQQIAVMRALVLGLAQRYPITAVVTHAMVAPGRKSDPEKCPNFRLSDYPLGA